MMSDSTAETPQAEIARLKERLAFYEGFDDLIQEQVSRSSDLLKAALQSKEAAALFSEEQQHHLRAEQELDLEQYRSLFSRLLDEITVLQTQAEHLAVILADAVDEIEAKVPVGGALPRLPDLIPEPFADADRVPVAPADTAPTTELDTPAKPIEEKAWAAFVPKPAKTEPVAEPADPTPPAVNKWQTPNPPTVIAEDEIPAHDPSQPLTLLVHGVPGAAVAISIKRHLEEQPGIISVEPRELTAGLLRLQVMAEHPNFAWRFRRVVAGI